MDKVSFMALGMGDLTSRFLEDSLHGPGAEANNRHQSKSFQNLRLTSPTCQLSGRQPCMRTTLDH